MKARKIFFLAILVLIFSFSSLIFAVVPPKINYQGKITTPQGALVDTTVGMTFTIYDSPTDGETLWTETQPAVVVEKGVFSVILGTVPPIDDSVFDGTVRYLGVKVGADPEMTPRKEIVSVGYAFKSEYADTSEYAFSAAPDDDWDTDTSGFNIYRLTGNVGIGSAIPPQYKLDVGGTVQMTGFKMLIGASNGYVLTSDGSGMGTWQSVAGGDNDWTFRITDTADTTLITGGAWGIARYGNVLHGNADSTHVNLGVACTTGISGQDRKYCTTGGGVGNNASGTYSTVSGGIENKATGNESTVGGGRSNTASGLQATVAGGYAGLSSGESSTIGGGWYNTASGIVATVAGGQENTASGIFSAVGGGSSNTASSRTSTIGGGETNTANGPYTTISGGSNNTSTSQGSSVGGGEYNLAIGGYATVGGGFYDTASGHSSIVGGGYLNTSSGDYSTVGGGDENTASGMNSTVGGGESNTAGTSRWATVGGGYYNTSSGRAATVGGGQSNTASGYWATVPGGYADTAAGDHSLAAGRGVKISSSADYTFAFGKNFSTSTPNAVIFCHYTGTSDSTKVGIGKTDPVFGIDLPNVSSNHGKGRAYAWTTYSSKRWKEKIRPIQAPLEKVMKLRGVCFDWRNTKQHDIGMIAEEVGEVVPEVVAYEENGVDAQALDYARLSALLVEAIKEQQKEIELLKKKIKAMETGER